MRPRPRVDPFAAKIEEWVDRSNGRIRADKAHERLVAMGYVGSERTTRRAVAQAKRAGGQEHGRRTRPWMPEPGLWMQWDYGDGPEVGGPRDVAVLRLACLVALPGRGAAVRPHAADGGAGARPDAAALRRRADLRA